MKIKLICAILLACVLLGTMIGCQASGGDTDASTEAATTEAPETAAPPVVIRLAELSEYALVRPEETDDTLIRAATDLLKAINSACGSSMSIKTDFYKAGMKGYEIVDREILVGDTNRPQSAAFLAELRAEDYGYGIVDGKLVIAGHSSEMTAKAVELFCNHVLDGSAATRAEFFVEGQGQIHAGSYPLDAMTLCGKSINSYTIVYAAENQAFEKPLAGLLADHIASLTGYVLAVAPSDKADAAKLKICIGDM